MFFRTVLPISRNFDLIVYNRVFIFTLMHSITKESPKALKILKWHLSWNNFTQLESEIPHTL